MDQKEVLQATERAGFADLNGQIMRMCNILKPSQRTLNAVYSLCKNNPNFAYTVSDKSLQTFSASKIYRERMSPLSSKRGRSASFASNAACNVTSACLFPMNG